MLDYDYLYVRFNLLGIVQLTASSWIVNCMKNKKGEKYTSILYVQYASVTYKQRHYVNENIDDLFRRITRDMKGNVII